MTKAVHFFELLGSNYLTTWYNNPTDLLPQVYNQHSNSVLCHFQWAMQQVACMTSAVSLP
jgi:hypothetical protein